jgi:hypothetical protein
VKPTCASIQQGANKHKGKEKKLGGETSFSSNDVKGMDGNDQERITFHRFYFPDYYHPFLCHH